MSHPSLAAEALSKWNAIASHWDAGIGRDGNRYWRVLQEPCLRRMLGAHLAKPGCRALDVATGNGLCARWMKAQGAAAVVATDGSSEMLRGAEAHEGGEGVEWRVLDVTVEEDWEGLVARERGANLGGFNVILMNMAIMDVATLEPLAKALPLLLAEDGVFVATVLHPVFFTSNASRNIEIKDNPVTGEFEVIRSKVITEYLHVAPYKGIATADQPEKQIYFHRPMDQLFTTFFKTGMVLDGMEELAFTEADFDPKRVESSVNYTQLPAILAWRMRFPSK
ncbi:ribosomal protein L11 methyltransferase [Podospora conica]|nr:ribosomal protein L11 methyltransferase [Schizothecium conicum]